MDVNERQIPGAYPDPPPLHPPSIRILNTPAVWSCQTEKWPVHFWDILPEPPIPAVQIPMVYLMVTNPLTTAMNLFGLFENYLSHPSHDLDLVIDPSDLSKLHAHAPPPPSPEPNEVNHGPPWLFSNMSVWRLMQWVNTGSRSKSEGKVNWLVNNVLSAPDFQTEDLQNFSTHQENGCLDAANKANPLGDNFQVTLVTIEVPTGDLCDSETSCSYSVSGLHYQKLLSIIKAAFLHPLSSHFHLTPFLLMHNSPTTGVEQQVYGELYNSDALKCYLVSRDRRG